MPWLDYICCFYSILQFVCFAVFLSQDLPPCPAHVHSSSLSCTCAQFLPVLHMCTVPLCPAHVHSSSLSCTCAQFLPVLHMCTVPLCPAHVHSSSLSCTCAQFL